jgi:hypothetical protein
MRSTPTSTRVLVWGIMGELHTDDVRRAISLYVDIPGAYPLLDSPNSYS